MTDDYQIRPALESDREQWDSLWQAYLTFYKSSLAPEITDELWRRIHDPAHFAGMHKAGELAARILDEIAEHVFPGQTTGEIDRLIEEKVDAAGATSASSGRRSTPSDSARDLKRDSAAEADSFMTSPSWPVTCTLPVPG